MNKDNRWRVVRRLERLLERLGDHRWRVVRRLELMLEPLTPMMGVQLELPFPPRPPRVPR